jgi:hypothetical protein
VNWPVVSDETSRWVATGYWSAVRLAEAKQAFYKDKMTVAHAFEIGRLQPNDQRPRSTGMLWGAQTVDYDKIAEAAVQDMKAADVSIPS